jgi:hypothetical protein
MARYIVNSGPHKEVHRTELTVVACRINEISRSHRIDTDSDYTVLYPAIYDGCKHCYKEKHWK